MMKSPGIKGQIMTFKVLETHDEGPVLKGTSVLLFSSSHALMHEYLRFSLLFLVGFVFLGRFFFFFFCLNWRFKDKQGLQSQLRMSCNLG